MKTLIVTMVYTLKVPNKFKLKEMKDGTDAIKVGKRFARPSMEIFNWKDEKDPDHLCSGSQDEELTELLWNYVDEEDIKCKLV